LVPAAAGGRASSEFPRSALHVAADGVELRLATGLEVALHR